MKNKNTMNEIQPINNCDDDKSLVVLLVDVDGTLTAMVSGQLTFNDDLIEKLRERKKIDKNIIILLFTSYMIEFNLRMNVLMGNTRSQVLDYLESKEVEVDGVITTASPYAERIERKGANPSFGFGQYYYTNVKNTEMGGIEALKNSKFELDVYVENHKKDEISFLTDQDDETKDDVTKLREEYRQFPGETVWKQGKEEMFRYVMWRYRGSCVRFEIFDDKDEVIKVAEMLCSIENVDIQREHVIFPPQNNLPSTPPPSPKQKKKMRDKMNICCLQ